MSVKHTEDDLKNAFKILDTDGSGAIDVKEFREVLGGAGFSD